MQICQWSLTRLSNREEKVQKAKPLRKAKRLHKTMRAESHSPGLLGFFVYFNSWSRAITQASKII